MLLKMLTLEAGLIRLAKDSCKEHLKLFRFELKQYLVFKMLRFPTWMTEWLETNLHHSIGPIKMRKS